MTRDSLVAAMPRDAPSGRAVNPVVERSHPDHHQADQLAKVSENIEDRALVPLDVFEALGHVAETPEQVAIAQIAGTVIVGSHRQPDDSGFARPRECRQIQTLDGAAGAFG
jgi:hypothetical protein